MKNRTGALKKVLVVGVLPVVLLAPAPRAAVVLPVSDGVNLQVYHPLKP